ncbi:MAG: hypothetical protein R8G01_23365 [Ilumatobacteraceae bacterium]|nr:hypothetical protein [Ilumatobacteraceae bacterium]
MPRLVLHAGLPKTGSTSIQRFLNANAEALGEQGVWFRPVADRKNRRDHNFLAMAFWNRVQRIYADRYGDDLERLRGDSLQAWTGQLDEFRQSDQETLLISGEFFTRAGAAHVAAFAKEQLTDFDISVVFYLRQPSTHYVSWLQQHLKGSNKMMAFGRNRSNWARRLRMWRKVGDVTVREFSRATLVGGDVVDDFASVLGVDIRGFDRPTDANESISAEGMDLLVEHRRFHWPDGRDRIMPESLRLIEQIHTIEAAAGDRLGVSPARLKPELAAYLDTDVEELAKLDRNFGFRYSAIGDPAVLSPIGDPDELEGRVFESLDQLVTIDPEARARLKAELIDRGAKFGRS